MILVVPETPLAQLLASGTLITQTWPQVNDDVFLLVHILKITLPSLAEVLSTGLVVLVASSPHTAEVTLSTGGAHLNGLAKTKDGQPVTGPNQRADEVVRIDIVDVVAEGRSAVKVAR